MPGLLSVQARWKRSVDATDNAIGEAPGRGLRGEVEKLQAIDNKVGYPDVFRDYSSIAIKSGDLLGNLQRASA